MQVKLSPLQLLDFTILQANLKYTPFKDGEDINDIVSAYTLEVDYAVTQNEAAKQVNIYIKADINKGNVRSGYSIFMEGAAVFAFADDSSEKIEEKNNALGQSGVPITLSHLRGAISDLTAKAPIGRYIMPLIDVGELYKTKQESLLTEQRKKEQVQSKSDKK